MPSAHRTLRAADVRALTEACFVSAEGAPSDERIGIELEWLTISARRPDDRLDLDALRTAAGSAPLPGGGTTSFEPGGQLELNSAPLAGLDAALTAAAADARELSARRARVGVGLVPIGLDAVRPPRRVLHSARYDAMEAAFDARGDHGRRMMCNTAALQVNVDLGPDPAARWRLAHALGPTLVACFANSPFGAGPAGGRPSGWRANRLATWWGIDPSRTAAPSMATDPATAWREYALAANVLLIQGGAAGRDGGGHATPVTGSFPFARWMAEGHPSGWPTVDDLAYHLTTLFPPVRPRGWFELRMLDAVDDEVWPVAVAVTVALLTDPDAAAAAADATVGTAGRWADAARCGLSDPDLARSADACFTAALDAVPRRGGPAALGDAVAAFRERYVSRRRCPADDRLDEWHALGRLLPEGTDSEQEPAWVS